MVALWLSPILYHGYGIASSLASAVGYSAISWRCSVPLPPARDVTLTGYVDDVRPWVARAWCSVVPLRIGGGTA
jgi:hypothetical protein